MSAVIYLLSVACLLVAVFLIKKSDNSQNALVWFISSAFLVISNQALFAGIFSLFHIGISIISIGIMNYLSAAVCIFFITRLGIQKYYIRAIEIIEVILILCLIYKFAILRFGHDLHINFAIVDAASHYKMAENVAVNHSLSNNMYFAALTSGLMMEVHKVFTHGDIFHMYKIFIICEIIYTAFSALLFWSVIRDKIKDNKFKSIAAFILTLIYWIGYPAYSTIFGFSYFVMSINIITLLIMIVNAYLSDDYNKKILIIFFNLLLHGIFVCYTLFVPTTFFGVFAAIAIYMIKRDGKKVINLKNFLEMLRIFLIPTILGLVQSFSNVKYLSGSGEGISHDGGCYSDLYSNFVPLLPFALIGAYIIIEKKKKDCTIPITIVQLLFMFILFCRAMNGTVSAYYYMKNNSLLWALIWILTIEAILYMIERQKAAIIFPLMFVAFIIMGQYGDPWINARNSRFIAVSSRSTFNIIFFNEEFMYVPSAIDQETIDLFEYAYNNCQDKEIISVNTEAGNGWFDALNKGGRLFCYGGLDEYMSMLDENVGYACITYTDPYNESKEYFDGLTDVIYENSSGKVVRINPLEKINE